MSRLMHGDAPAAFRAVITTRDVADHFEGGVHEHTHYAGPYGTVGAARAAITRAQKDAARYWRGSRTVTGYPERSPIEWERVE
ncbi:hypothetical protein [Micromonospora sp. NPDC023956]|uniref:hypothetical protein n=1 Tax=Micromonospora sp. NPDC023956 TaxID=3155722 RepID=UPI003402B8D7